MDVLSPALNFRIACYQGRALDRLQLISAFGRLQNFFWRLTDGEGVSRSYERNDRTSVPNFVSEERDSIVEIYMDDLPSLRRWDRLKKALAEIDRISAELRLEDAISKIDRVV
jgi:hypothetical protein